MRFWDLPHPNKLDGLGDSWIETVMNRTTEGGCFQQFFLRMILWKWNGDFRFKCDNSSGRIGAHFFGCFDLHALKVDRVSLGRDSHDRGHTGGQRGRDEIGRRKRFALSLVVDGGVGR